MTSTLARILADGATAHADADAFVDIGRTWTFAEASDDSGRVAAALIELGVTAGDRVGVHLHKCGEGAIAMHGVVRSGAVAVPLDPSSPAARLARICEQMQIDVVVTHEPRRRTIVELLGVHDLRGVVGLDDELPGTRTISRAALSELPPRPPAPVHIGDRAFIITTSGTTGEPKGIVHTHESAMAWVESSNQAFGLTSTDRVADIAPHHFDISTQALWAAPRVGAAAVVIPEPYQRLAASHSQRLEDESLSVWYSVPFLLRQLVHRGDLANRDLSHLRWVLFGGEVLPPQDLIEFSRLVPSARLANLYGPAETNTATYHVFDAAIDPSGPLSIGGPWSGTELRIVDPDLERPAGDRQVDEGELWIAADTMMEGYWGRSDLDAASLVDEDGSRWYRSGDLVRRGAGGELVFLGRADHQVKVRGHRIELEGVEVELETLVGVDNAVVAVERTATGEDQLVVGVLGSAGLDPASLLSGARAVLPAYAVPSRVVVLDAAIFTGSGKLDRRTLRSRVLDMLETS